MCTLRGLWLLSDSGEVLFSRRYNTVERRVSRTQGYVQIPNDTELARQVMEKINNPHNEETKHYVILSLQGGSLWPVVYVKRPHGILQVAIMMIENIFRDENTENTPVKQLPLINLPFITAAVTLLQDLVPFIEAHGPKYTSQNLKNLNSPLSMIMPFGKPLDTNLTSITQLSTIPFSVNGEDLSSKRPASMPHLYKGGKQSMEFQFIETINGIQYDREKAQNLLQIRGCLQCKVSLEGIPEVTVPLTLVENMPGKLGQINVHSCVQNTDHEKKLQFSPLMETQFVLCRYIIEGVDKIPVRGYYQMKEKSATEVKLLLQLKLDESVRNEFEYCRIILPFFNHGTIENVVAANTAGELIIREDKKALLWDIGTKFTARDKQVALPATVHFNINSKGEKVDEDPFCVGANCYAKMEFKILSYGHLTIMPKNVSIYPKGTSTPKIIIDRSLVSGEYLIWNSMGNVKYAWNSVAVQKAV